ncbi:MAG TPA: glycosyltransferase family 4 protein [Candidatus Methanoperedenaceae archaeon]|nr:glycosyltransferase family 4 protein [Candidatus Methanoperedenaceae archaeon]
MKIGLLAYDLTTLAGGTNLALTLGRELQKAGHELAYACVYEDLRSLAGKFDVAADFKIYRVGAPVFGKAMKTYNSMLNHSLPIYRMCREFKPDVVIETGGFLLSSAVPVMLGIPTIYYCLEPQREYSRGSFMNRLYFTPYTLIEPYLLKRVKTCAISAYTGRLIRKHSGGEVTVIYPPVDTEIFKPGIEKENIILCVLRFLPGYRFEEMILAFRRLQRTDYSLVIIGGLAKENKGYYDNLRKMIKDDTNITLLPNADFSTLLDYYKKARFFWYPTGAYYGISVAEAQSAGLPVVSFGGDSGPGEIIIDAGTGFLVKTFDEMVEKSKSLINNRQLRERMSISARENAVSRLGTTTFCTKFNDVIRRIVSR